MTPVGLSLPASAAPRDCQPCVGTREWQRAWLWLDWPRRVEACAYRPVRRLARCSEALDQRYAAGEHRAGTVYHCRFDVPTSLAPVLLSKKLYDFVIILLSPASSFSALPRPSPPARSNSRRASTRESSCRS